MYLRKESISSNTAEKAVKWGMKNIMVQSMASNMNSLQTEYIPTKGKTSGIQSYLSLS